MKTYRTTFNCPRCGRLVDWEHSYSDDVEDALPYDPLAKAKTLLDDRVYLADQRDRIIAAGMFVLVAVAEELRRIAKAL